MKRPTLKKSCGYHLALAAVLGGLPGVISPMRAAEAPEDPAGEKEEAEPKWESSAGLAFALSRGNSENMLFAGNLDTQHLGKKNEWRFGLSGGYGESRPADDGDPTTEERLEKNTEYFKAYGQYDRLLSERWYALARVDAIYDGIADIDYRVPLSVGVGYYFIKNEKIKLSADAGPGYVWEKVGGERDEYATIRIGQQFEWKISKNARLWEAVDYTPEVTDFENYVLNAVVGVEAKLVGNLSLRLMAENTYRSQPAPGRDENDFKLLAGLNYKF